MRKLILFLLLLASPAWAGGVISGAVLSGCSTGGGAGAAAFCTGATTCTATTPGNCEFLCEDFAGSTQCDDSPATASTCRAAKAVSQGTGQTIVTNASHSGTLGCTDKGSYALQCTSTQASQSCNMGYDSGGDQAVMYLDVYVNVKEITVASGSTQGLAYIGSGAFMDGTVELYVKNTDGTYTLQMICDSCAAGVESSAISLDVWYRVTLMANDTTNTAQLWVNGVSVGTRTDYDSAKKPRCAALGWSLLTTRLASAAVVQWDNWAISASQPGGCNE